MAALLERAPTSMAPARNVTYSALAKDAKSTPFLMNPSPPQVSPTSSTASPIIAVAGNPVTDQVAARSTKPHDKDGPDVVFIGHPAYLTDVMALFYTPSFEKRWTPSWWMYLMLPILWVIGFLAAHMRRRITGVSHIVVDDVYYNGIRIQTWVVHHFGRHFRNSCELHDSRKNVVLAAQNAEKAGARILGLGALNKAEFLNHGGRDLLPFLPDDRTMAITHGNHLTAAAVVETARQLYEAGFARGKPCFITGATSKTGRAVAIALHKFHKVPLLCHSGSEERRQELVDMGMGATGDFADGKDCAMWIIGKYDLRVCDHMPKDSLACVFAVPNPLEVAGTRPDVTILEGATLHIDMKRLSKPRKFTNLLRADEIYACHAGSILRACTPELGTQDELGAIDPDTLVDFIKRAEAIGITVPPPPKQLLEHGASDSEEGSSDDDGTAMC